MTHPSVPSLPGRLLGRFLPPEDIEAVLGDLDEAFRQRVAHAGPMRARLWYWRTSLGVMAAFRGMRSLPSTPQRREAATMLRAMSQDIRFGARLLIRSPGFTLITVLTLALGIGATTAIFSAVNPILFRELPYPAADRLVIVWEREPNGAESNLGYATIDDLARDARSLSSIAAMAQWAPTISGDDETERLEGQSVSAAFFATLGVRPMLGRDFRPEEDQNGANRVVMLSHGLWRRRFGGDSSIVNRTVQVNGLPYLVAGVLPKDFESLLAPSAELWRPLGYDASLSWACRTCRHLRAVARVAPGIPVSQAEAELNELSRRYVREHPKDYGAPGMFAVELRQQLARGIRPILRVMLGAVAFVLLIACANVMSLTLTRAAERQGEFSIRAALGAGRPRVARQLLTEGLLLGLLGGGLGVLVGWAGLQALLALHPAGLPRIDAMRLDLSVLALTATLAIGTGLVFGLAPLLWLGRRGSAAGLSSSRFSLSAHRRRALSTLVVAEVALAFMLLAGAGLLIRSVRGLLEVDPGFRTERLLTMEVMASGPAYREDAPVWTMQDRVLDAVRAVPGVASASMASQIPLGGNWDSYGVQIKGRPLDNPEEAPSAMRYAVAPAYLEVMGIPLLQGRRLEDQDRGDAPPVVVINEAFARLSWPGENPIGQQVQIGGPSRPWRTIVGIVGNVRHASLDAKDMPQFYVPARQWPWAENGTSLVLRTTIPEPGLQQAVRTAIRSVDPHLAISQVATAEELVSRSAADRRFAMSLFALFALVAMGLAAAGIYGVLSGSVTARTREIGIRSALGATRGGILGFIVREGMSLTVIGLVLGAVGATMLSRFLQKLLYGVSPTDPMTLAGSLGILAVIALAACAGPAWRATRVDPVRVLKAE